MINNIIKHYDTLIGLDNDPARDPEPLKEYMDKWDGQEFIDTLQLDDKKSILEIGVGTGRLGIRVASLCKYFVGIDISPKTIERAKENFKKFNNVTLYNGHIDGFSAMLSYDEYKSLELSNKEKNELLKAIRLLISTNNPDIQAVEFKKILQSENIK